MDTQILNKMSYGVYIVSSVCGEKPVGCIVNSAIQVTYDTIAISIHHSNFTHKCVEDSGKFALSILGVDVEENVIPVFGFQSGKDVNKFQNFDYITVDGLPVLEDTIGYIVCQVIGKLETDTHTVFLGKIIDTKMLKDDIPMTYAYYHAVKKGLSPKNAPTYKEEKTEHKLAYRCKICGYIYEGDITKEPDSYVCPICKKGKEFFEKI